jgi:hypothetical protein
MARALIRTASEILDQDASARGHLAGCNAIFLESSVTPTTEIPQGDNTYTEISYDHHLLAKMGYVMFLSPLSSLYLYFDLKDGVWWTLDTNSLP